MINEWMASNQSAVADPVDGRFDDWFEIFNPGDIPYELAGYFLTDDLDAPRKFVIPPGTIIPPRGFLLVWADEEERQSQPGGDLHVNFRLSQEGEVIALFSPEGILVNHVEFAAAFPDSSTGRWPDGGLVDSRPLTHPTPGAPNAPPTGVDLSVRFIEVARDSDGRVRLTWESVPGAAYRLETTDQLAPAGWTSVTAEIPSAGLTTSVVDPSPSDSPQRFYRIRRER
jgi:hypothetical protein